MCKNELFQSSGRKMNFSKFKEEKRNLYIIEQRKQYFDLKLMDLGRLISSGKLCPPVSGTGIYFPI
jgi:hypothetical protein